MKKILVSLALIGSAFVAGCSGSGGSSGNSGTNNCNADTDCPTGDVCNTAGHVCMINCASGSSACPTTEMQCMTVPASAGNAGTAATTAVCQCATDALCGGGSTYCDQTTDFICEVTCSDNSGCQGYSDSTRVCTGGHCVIGVADAGPTACTATSCTAPETCNTTTGQCEAPGSCGTAGTLGNCTAGLQYCDGTVCQTVAACAAVTSGAPATTANSPLIWDVAADGNTRMDTNCTDASTGNMIAITEFKGKYLNNGTGVVPTGTSSNGTGVYKNVGYIKASGGTVYTTYQNVTIDSTTFTFEICGYSSGDGLHVGALLIDGAGGTLNAAGSQITPTGDVSEAACFPWLTAR